MKFPKSIDVLGTRWKIKVVERCSLGEEGETDPDLKTIFIKITCKDQWGVFLHELGHAISYSAGLFEGMDDAKMSEVMVEQYSKVLQKLFHMSFK